METEKLFYQDAYLRETTAKVVECRQGKHGYEIVLDRTCFYPEGGGQPGDHGTLNGIPVVDTHEKDGLVLHDTNEPIEVGTEVKAVIDWDRRFDLTQQHSGEHMVSGVVHRIYGYDNVGFHMGADMVTIDFSGELTEQQLRDVEQEVNERIWLDSPVKCWYPSPEELKEIPYRSKKELTGKVRIVEFPGADICACCGTHVERTGEVGIIKIRGMIHYKGGVRISMLCGRRAVEDYRMRLDDMTELSVLLSAKLGWVPEAVKKLVEEKQNQEMRIGVLYRQLFALKAENYPESEKPLAVFEEGLSPAQLRQLATMLYEKEKGAVVGVFSPDGNGGFQYALGSSRFDMRSLSRAMNQKLNGRGGGSALMAQGTFRAEKTEIEAVFAGEACSYPNK